MKRNLLPILLVFFISCSEDPKIVNPTIGFEILVPTNLANSLPQPSDNLATAEGIALGKKLFFDPKLSKNGQVSCVTCHHPELAFADGLALTNKGVSGKSLLRNSPALFNLAWAKGYFADGGAKNLESQVFAPLQHEDEMDIDVNELINELNTDKVYREMSRSAFGIDTINSTLLVKAIAQFERSLISGNSKYDQWTRGEGKILNDLELNGLEVYKSKCETCHKADFFTDFDYHNNGIDSIFTDNSHENVYKGRYRISGKTEDIGKYKTPSLRNLSFTAPYMHDGRFSTIDEVIKHYSNGIKSSATLDQNIPKEGFGLNEIEIEALKAFLKTLDDHDFIAKSILLKEK